MKLVDDPSFQHCLEHGQVCVNEDGVEYLKDGDVKIKGDWPGCDRSLPDVSIRFGERRRWHKRYEFLYYEDSGALVAPFTFEEGRLVRRTESCRPVHTDGLTRTRTESDQSA